MSDMHPWLRNQLLARLTAAARDHSHVIFPTTAIVSLLHVLEDGGSAEIAVIGQWG